MTSVSHNVGLNTESKNSSRVLAPPGGASSNIFGSAADAEPKDAAQQHKKRFESSNIFGDPEAPNTPKANANKPADNSQSNIFGATGSGEAPRVNAKKQGVLNPITGNKLSYVDDADVPDGPQTSKHDRGRGRYNPITGQDYQPDQAERPSSKVRQPPGGKSEGLW